MIRLSQLAACALLALAAPAMAQVEAPSVVQHQLKLSSGKVLRYETIAGRVPIRDGASDEAHAQMFFVAYRVPSATPRPVTFLWNGGPGAASATLHLQSIGPRRVDGAGGIVDFPDTVLATTDLVFVDAVGTGFSRLTKREYAKEFYDTTRDVKAFTDFVRAWRHLYKAEAAPLFIGGESWGSFRAAEVTRALLAKGDHVEGALLISGRTGLMPSEPDDSIQALRTVEQAVAAQYHGKLSPSLPKDRAALEREVTAWVNETYAPALKRVSTLSGAERDAIVARLSLYTGLRPDQIDHSTLIVTAQYFLDTLMKDQGKTLQTNDMLAFNTPVDPRPAQAVNRYLRDELAYRTDREYIDDIKVTPGFSPDDKPMPSVNSQWDYETGYYIDTKSRDERWAWNQILIERGNAPLGQSTPAAEQALALDPKVRFLFVGGRNDSLSSCAGVAEVIGRQTPGIKARYAQRCYDGGHMFYKNPQTRRAFSADLQAFVRGDLK